MDAVTQPTKSSALPRRSKLPVPRSIQVTPVNAASVPATARQSSTVKSTTTVRAKASTIKSSSIKPAASKKAAPKAAVPKAIPAKQTTAKPASTRNVLPKPVRTTSASSVEQKSIKPTAFQSKLRKPGSQDSLTSGSSSSNQVVSSGAATSTPKPAIGGPSVAGPATAAGRAEAKPTQAESKLRKPGSQDSLTRSNSATKVNKSRVVTPPAVKPGNVDVAASAEQAKLQATLAQNRLRKPSSQDSFTTQDSSPSLSASSPPSLQENVKPSELCEKPTTHELQPAQLDDTTNAPKEELAVVIKTIPITDAPSVADLLSQEGRKPRLSLSERTIETLANLPNTPSSRRRKSSFFNPDSPMRPKSAAGVVARPGPGMAKQIDFSNNETPLTAKRTIDPMASLYRAPSRDKSVAQADAPTIDLKNTKNLPALITKGPQALTQRKAIQTNAQRPRVSSGNGPVNGLAGVDRNDVTPALPKTKGVKSSSTLRETIAKQKAEAAKRAATIKAAAGAGKIGAGDKGQCQKPTGNLSPRSHDDFETGFGLGPKDNKGLLRKCVDAGRVEGRLDISAMGLKEIPYEVLNMYDLDSINTSKGAWYQSVDLTRFVAADNEIEDLGVKLFPDQDPDAEIDSDDKGMQFGGIETLDLHGNLLKLVPVGLRRLEQLTSLNLSNNKLDNSCLEIVSQCLALKELRLANNGLQGQLPEALTRLTGLETLDLRCNALTAFPDSMEALARLRAINVSENKLGALPFTSFSKMPLVQLLAQQNDLRGTLIPAEVKVLGSLQILNIACNGITSLTESMAFSFPSLQELIMSNNRITSLPDVTTWTKTISIMAADNKIGNLPAGFTALKNVKNIDLTGNELRFLDNNICRMNSLVSLSIASNPLRDRRFLTLSTEDLKHALRERLSPELNGASSEEGDLDSSPSFTDRDLDHNSEPTLAG